MFDFEQGLLSLTDASTTYESPVSSLDALLVEIVRATMRDIYSHSAEIFQIVLQGKVAMSIAACFRPAVSLFAGTQFCAAVILVSMIIVADIVPKSARTPFSLVLSVRSCRQKNGKNDRHKSYDTRSHYILHIHPRF
jgi:hypothetical protein